MRETKHSGGFAHKLARGATAMTVAAASAITATPALAGPANTCGTNGTTAPGYTLGTLGPGLTTNQLAFTDPAGPWKEGLYITNPAGPPAVLAASRYFVTSHPPSCRSRLDRR